MKTITEKCIHCKQKVELKNKFIKQQCPNCMKLILPCSICNEHQFTYSPINNNPFKCRKCPFEEYN